MRYDNDYGKPAMMDSNGGEDVVGGMCSPHSQDYVAKNVTSSSKTPSKGNCNLVVQCKKDLISKDSVSKVTGSKDCSFNDSVSRNSIYDDPKSKKVPKYNNAGDCLRCKSSKSFDEAIHCNLCNDLFHAVCLNEKGRIADSSICPRSFLDQVRPAIAHYGKFQNRFGNFMYFCNKCTKKVKSLAKSNCNGGSKVPEMSKFQNAASQTNSDVTVADCASNTEPHAVINMEATKSISAMRDSDGDGASDGNMIASVASVVTKNVQCMLSNLKDDLLASVEERVSEKLQSALAISSPLSSTFARQRVPSSVNTVGSDDFLTTSISSSSIELSSSEENPTHSYANALKSSFEHHPTESATKKTATPSQSMSLSRTSENIENVPFNDNSDHILVLNAKNDAVNLHKAEEQLDDLFKNIPTNLIKNNVKNKKIVMIFPSENAKEKGRKALEKHPDVLNKSMTFADAKKMFPKITVTNVPNYLVADILSENNLDVPTKRDKLKRRMEALFMEKNEQVQDLVANHGRTFTIIYVNPGENFTSVGIKVSPDIRYHLIEARWIYIGNTRCKVTDRFDLKQCYKCQKFGHKSDQCREPQTICKYCSASHPTRTCPHKHDREQHRCINCSHSSNEQFKALCHTHHSAAESCPIIMMETENLRKKTEYSKNM